MPLSAFDPWSWLTGQSAFTLPDHQQLMESGNGPTLAQRMGVPPEVLRYMRSAPSMMDSGQITSGPMGGEWPYPYAGMGQEAQAQQQPPNYTALDREMMAHRGMQQLNLPQREGGTVGTWGHSAVVPNDQATVPQQPQSQVSLWDLLKAMGVGGMGVQ